MRKVLSVLAAVLVAIAMLPMAGSAQPRAAVASGSDVRHFDPKAPRHLVTTNAAARQARSLAARNAAPPQVGDQRIWLALDDENGVYYPKQYTLRGVGDHIEVWVASDEDDVSTGIDFPAGDCRNDGVRNVITDENVQYLVDQFDNVIYPAESEVFSVPPSLDGSDAPLAGALGLPKNYYKGQGDRVVTLIDNVRDQNFYDTDNANGYSYIAGFFSDAYDYYYNRLAMTIDAFDWLHRTGDNPPNDPSTDLCTNATARPHLYEGTFAHEYQHLLESYVDPDEVNWVNEGLSDWAQTLVGYVDATVPVSTIGFDSHVQCFLGYNDVQTPANPIPRPGGPENSLTRWGDQTDFEQEILCDYGAAYTFMLYLANRFGQDFMTALHHDQANGLDSLSHLLKQEDPNLTPGGVITDWALSVAIDKVIDAGWTVVGDADPSTEQVTTLNADINWDNDQAYSAPGAPANGSDYVRLRDDADAYLSVDQVQSIDFNGASTLPSLPLEWSVDKNSPKNGGKALFSQMGDNLDHGMAFETKVKNGDAKLSFDTFYKTEAGYDWFYVQVSSNGGKSFKSIRCSGTNANGTLGPAFEGKSGGWVHESCNLKRYAGQKVVISFRYVTDGGVALAGVWVDNVEVGSKLVSDGSIKPFDSPTQINPTDVQQFVVRLVAFDQAGHVVHVFNLPLDDRFDGSISDSAITDALGSSGNTVAAIVTYLDRSEEVQQEAPYTLTVNGVVQPGGGGA